MVAAYTLKSIWGTKAAAEANAAEEARKKEEARKNLDTAWNAYKNVNWGDVNSVRTANVNINNAIQPAITLGIDTNNYSVDKALATFQPKTTSGSAATPTTSTGGAASGNSTAQTFANEYAKLFYARGSATNSGDQYWGKIGKDGLAKLISAGSKVGKTEWNVLHDLANVDSKNPLHGNWEKILKAYIEYKGSEKAAYNAIHSVYKKGATSSNKREEKWNKVFTTQAYKFKKGGIANFTGPAWLDGTPSKPELVLNATDTKNFLMLRDVLSKAIGSANSIENSYGGDATYEININVDKLTNDYDVDKVAERVKKIIVKDSGYRNVTQVRNFR